ncbi:hypothetical protein KZ483_23970 [Paenibacillus sp. sptzw28]|uniref:hypothetical protein n=1 Tax=Paenibacillus sp. sptzw28 TaxID=715179 RepID=UPI001C6F3E8B|nr:hypothetical protein [Paenibacillus sp. sptzw28]QYR20780.1 hypothetical protein KZ483_23970 [Paenibacillus sp. sptzw28]
MFKSGFILSTGAHIDAAMHNKTPVTVWMNNEIVDYGGVIEGHTEYAVQINGDWFPKKIVADDAEIRPCQFRVR